MPEKKKRTNTNIRVFFIILLATAAVSVMIKLNRNFTFSVAVPLQFTNLPEDQILRKFSAKKVKVSAVASGYDYLKYRFFNQEFEIDLSGLKKKNDSIKYYVFNEARESLQGSLSESEIKKFKPDTVFFHLDQNYQKKVPVKSQITVSYAPGFGSLEGLKLKPDTVTVRGPKSIIDTIQQVFTVGKNLKEVKMSVTDSISLKLYAPLKNLEIIPPKIEYILEVEKFTEGNVTVPLQLINVPSRVTAKVFPKRVNVIFNVNFTNFQRVKPSDFKVVVDFKELDSLSTSLTPKVVEYPDYVTDIRLSEKTVQYLLVK